MANVCKYCFPPFEFSNKALLEEHLACHNYRCDVCVIGFLNRLNLVHHFETYHKSLCDICEEEVGEGKSVREDHIRNAHNLYPCAICNQYFSSAGLLKDHYDNPITHFNHCKLCRKEFRSSMEFWHHCFLYHREKCPLCDLPLIYNFAVKQQWDDHLKMTHRLFPCPFCYEVFYYQELAKDHINGTHRVKCKKCTETFLNEKELRNHGKVAHQIKCLICQECFQTETHLQIHNNLEHVFQCSMCKATFPSDNDYQQHFNLTHQIKCLICNQVFQTETNLKNHYDIEHIIRCNSCGVSMNNAAQQEKHSHLHQVQCGVCEVGLDSVRTLQLHYEPMHQIPCDQYGNVFATTSKVQLHYNQFHGVPLLNKMEEEMKKCSVCDEVFLSEMSLVEHYIDNHVEL